MEFKGYDPDRGADQRAQFGWGRTLRLEAEMRKGTTKAPARSPEMEADARWHLDKRIPITLLLAILAQTGAGMWWAATTSARIENLEKRADGVAPIADRMTRVEVKLEVVQDGVTEIKRILTKAK